MNSFFKTFFACFLAIIASSVFAFFAFFAIITMISLAYTPSPTTYESGSVLSINLSEIITDKEPIDPFELLDVSTMKIQKTLSIPKILSAIESAAADPKIEGIFLNINPSNPIGIANMTEIRNSLKKFKESGKFIVSYNYIYSQSSYFLSSVADKVFLAPEGAIQWNGMSSQTMFFKGTLEKLGVKPEIIRHGKYKSAVEPFTQDKMSPENREQISALLNSIWGYVVGEIATSRSLDSTLMQQYASDLSISSPEKAVELKLIDSLGYDNIADEWISNKLGGKENYNTVSLYNYINSNVATSSEYSKNKIAVIIAEGEIIASSSDVKGYINSNTLCKNLQDLRKDSSVKGVVIRINSPGGSALASDVIWNEVRLLQKTKPVVVSMGNTAASGGYYIAAPADIILAEPTTITGSIGVFGVLFNAQEGLKEKLGITIDAVNTNTYADMGSIARSLTDAERQYIQIGVEKTYNTFVSKVAEGRNLTVEKVDEIAGGRVWSGADAFKIGLIDGFGSVNDAVMIAADRAGVIDSFRIEIVGNNKTALSQVMSSVMEEVKVQLSGSSKIENSISNQYDKIKRHLNSDRIMTVMPYTLTIE